LVHFSLEKFWPGSTTLGYANTPAALMNVLEHVPALCVEYGLKLHLTKCCFHTREALWCGKLISALGVRHNLERIQELVIMPPPRTAEDLQQFICAVTWMRNSISNYSAVMAELTEQLEVAATQSKSRTKTHQQRVVLSTIGWGHSMIQRWPNSRPHCSRLCLSITPRQTEM
jgi:hypothetical protein